MSNKHIEVKITDAGRSTSSFSWERRDCTVRALAIAGDMPYDKAHQILSMFGRKDKHGFRSSSGLPKITKSKSLCRSGSLGKFIEKHSSGRYYVGVRCHAFALVDGIVHDMGQQGANRRILCAWKIG